MSTPFTVFLTFLTFIAILLVMIYASAKVMDPISFAQADITKYIRRERSMLLHVLAAIHNTTTLLFGIFLSAFFLGVQPKQV